MDRWGLVTSMVALWASLSLVTCRAANAAQFGYLKVKGGAATGHQPYGAVTLISPFSSESEGSIPLWLLVENGDFTTPWVRARYVARILPKVVELMLYQGEVLKVGPDEEGNPSIYVGPPSRPVSKSDLRIVSVLPGDRDRFERQKGVHRRLSCTAVAHYWKDLLCDMVNLFVRFPLSRDYHVLSRLKLSPTRVGAVFKRIMVEVSILLRYEDLTEQSATPEILRTKLAETLVGMTRDRWALLTRLAFAIPSDYPIRIEGDGCMDRPDRRRGNNDSPDGEERRQSSIDRSKAEGNESFGRSEETDESAGETKRTEPESVDAGADPCSTDGGMKRPWE